MVEAIKTFLIDNFSSIVWFAILLLSIIPITEARVAVPFAMTTEFWGDKALTPFQTVLVCFAGGMIISAILLLCLRPFFSWLRTKEKMKKLVEKIETAYKSKVKSIDDRKDNIFTKCFILYSFVALPVPFTGVWTGSLLASLTRLGFWKTFLTINLGNLTAIGLIMLICLVFPNSLLIILLAVVVLVLVLAIYKLVRMLIKKRVKTQTESDASIEK